MQDFLTLAIIALAVWGASDLLHSVWVWLKQSKRRFFASYICDCENKIIAGNFLFSVDSCDSPDYIYEKARTLAKKYSGGNNVAIILINEVK